MKRHGIMHICGDGKSTNSAASGLQRQSLLLFEAGNSVQEECHPQNQELVYDLTPLPAAQIDAAFFHKVSLRRQIQVAQPKSDQRCKFKFLTILALPFPQSPSLLLPPPAPKQELE